ncbi:MAG: endonuclease [Cyanobacteria bacterium P01_G01_bin.67]
MKKLLSPIISNIIAIFYLCCWFAFAQPGSVLAAEIFPDLDGAVLEAAIANEYRPESTLGYRRGRDILYTQIDNRDGTVTGIYTGYQAEISPDSESPRNDATAQNINAEHIYPQSKGAKGQAKSDLHSLFASRDRVNSARSNSPFAEINDALTQKWFRNEQELRSIPTALIDEYSESLNNRLFEPRENKKGDVARAMFYFYTVYRFQADEEDPNFFLPQQNILCQWNLEDPIDDQEQERSRRVAEFQGNENPFVLDFSLAQRTYCREP